MMKKTANIWEYKVGINAIIADFVCLWKCRMFAAKNMHYWRFFKCSKPGHCFDNILESSEV